MEIESWVDSVLQGPEDSFDSNAVASKWSTVFEERNLPDLETKLNELILSEYVGMISFWIHVKDTNI